RMAYVHAHPTVDHRRRSPRRSFGVDPYGRSGTGELAELQQLPAGLLDRRLDLDVGDEALLEKHVEQPEQKRPRLPQAREALADRAVNEQAAAFELPLHAGDRVGSWLRGVAGGHGTVDEPGFL